MGHGCYALCGVIIFLRRYTATEDGTSGNEHVHFRNYRKPVLIVQQWIPLCYGGGGEGGNEGEDEKEVHGRNGTTQLMRCNLGLSGHGDNKSSSPAVEPTISPPQRSFATQLQNTTNQVLKRSGREVKQTKPIK
ncbi:hypothetical protein ElyMa_002194800 [Elysia marginata]|uniref:Secreted protein n=1 Tax=Elysia marginata TaxID=1093978 RepID=A0AAV4FQJ5_9GAST|nr:hypothetical protein ElyMa_002194800 [Elysia marginata]